MPTIRREILLIEMRQNVTFVRHAWLEYEGRRTEGCCSSARSDALLQLLLCGASRACGARKVVNAPAFSRSEAARHSYVSQSDGLKAWDFGTQADTGAADRDVLSVAGKRSLSEDRSLSAVMRAGEFDKGVVARVDILPGQR
jgi:hypothetical protein